MVHDVDVTIRQDLDAPYHSSLYNEHIPVRNNLCSSTEMLARDAANRVKVETPLRRVQTNIYMEEPTRPIMDESAPVSRTQAKQERHQVDNSKGTQPPQKVAHQTRQSHRHRQVPSDSDSSDSESSDSSQPANGGKGQGSRGGGNTPPPPGPAPQPPMQLDVATLKQLMSSNRSTNWQQLMRVRPPVYTGSPREDVSEWLDKLESWMELAQLTDVHKIYLLCKAGVLMTGLPQLWIKQQSALASETQWDRFAQTIETRWMERAREKTYHREIRNVTMRGNYDSYCIKFQELTLKIKTMAMVDVLDAFYQGLPESYRWEIVKRNPERLAQAMEYGRDYHQAVSDMRAVSGRTQYGKSYSSAQLPNKMSSYASKGRHLPNKDGKTYRNSDSWEGGNSARFQGTCFICKRTGHRASECRSRSSSRSAIPLRQPAHPPSVRSQSSGADARQFRSRTPQRSLTPQRRFYSSKPANTAEHEHRVNTAPREAWVQMARTAQNVAQRANSSGGPRRENRQPQ